MTEPDHAPLSRNDAIKGRLIARLHASPPELRPPRQRVVDDTSPDRAEPDLGPVLQRLKARIAVWKAEGGRRSIPRRASRAVARRLRTRSRQIARDVRTRLRYRKDARRVASRPQPRAEDLQAARIKHGAHLMHAIRSEDPERCRPSSHLTQQIHRVLGTGPVVDICCAQGATLAAIAETAADPVGLDLFPDAVDACSTRGFSAYQVSWCRYLPALPTRSLRGIVASQRLIWLDADSLTDLVAMSRDALADDGVLVIELADAPQTPGDEAAWVAAHPYVTPTSVLETTTGADFDATLIPDPDGGSAGVLVARPRRGA